MKWPWHQIVSMVAFNYGAPASIAIAIREEHPFIIAVGVATTILFANLLIAWVYGLRVSTTKDREKIQAVLAESDKKLAGLSELLDAEFDTGEEEKRLADLAEQNDKEIAELDEKLADLGWSPNADFNSGEAEFDKGIADLIERSSEKKEGENGPR